MKYAAIADLLASRLNITSLNPMQLAMAGSRDALSVLIAPTGSGKTVAFSFPMLLSLRPADGSLQAVVIAPSRELVVQIAGVVRVLAAGYKTVALYGGHPFEEEARSLPGADIAVATPGRLLDHIRRGTADVSRVSFAVIDEYDKLLELGFEDELKRIMKRLIGVKRMILTSATRLDVLPQWLPVKAGPRLLDYSAAAGEAGQPKVPVVKVGSPVRDKLDTLTDLLMNLAGQKVIVFVNHRESAERVYRRLKDEGVPAGLYHGGLDQPQRENALAMFENGTTPVLVATDLGARGLDIEGVENVIHYHLPVSPEAWTHRNGRTGRQGAEGTVYVITAPEGEDFPEWITVDREWYPPRPADAPQWNARATLYFNEGKKDKISRGDIAGFLIAKGGLQPEEVGRIALRDHCALVAVPAGKAGRTLAAVSGEKIKGRRVKISRLG